MFTGTELSLVSWNVLEMEGGDGCLTCEMYLKSLNYIL